MSAVEFTADLSGKPFVSVPKDIADKLPKSGKARVIIMTNEDSGDAEWKAKAYQQFLRDDSPEDAVYDDLK